MSSAIISSFSSSKVDPSVPADIRQAAFDHCVARIQLVVNQFRFDLQKEQSSEIACPITLDFPDDPVVTSCGHLFSKTAIETCWDKSNPRCPICRHSLTTDLTPIQDLRKFIEDVLLKDHIIVFGEVIEPNQKLAEEFIQLADSCIEEKAFKEALDLHRLALQHINSSEVYAAIPALYDQLGEEKKALLSRLYLSLNQLQEGKIQEAVDTLEICKSNTLTVALKLLLFPSSENIEKAVQAALGQSNVEDSIFIYKLILIFVPGRLDIHQRLISLAKNLKEKQEFLLNAVEQAHATGQFDAEMRFRKESELPLISTVVSPQNWIDAVAINLPPYPQELKDFLAGECTIWRGKKRAETHIVVPCFPEVLIGDTSIPLTLNTLNQLDKSVGGIGLRWRSDTVGTADITDNFPLNTPSEKSFYYAVLTNNVIPGSKSKSYEELLQLLPKEYEVPGVFDVARAVLWENRRSGRRYFSDGNPLIFTYCKEIYRHPVYGILNLSIGGFDDSGLNIYNRMIRKFIGIAGWRKFGP